VTTRPRSAVTTRRAHAHLNVARLRASILRWYRKNRRDLPWRRTRDPYAIWISEIMLQQTRVETVIPFYERFLARFPTVDALSGARERDVLAAWSGLGYYTRARSLHAAAQSIAGRHAGALPRTIEALRALPGIGPYTAAAIASVAYGVPAAAVDGNVIRVLARIGGHRGRRDEPALRRTVDALANRLANGPSPGDWTQALMELGATVCLPRAPRCTACPARTHCVAHQEGNPATYPTPARTTPVPARSFVLLLARRGARVLLIREEETAKATWGLPSAPAERSTDPRTLAARLSRSLALNGKIHGPTLRFRHRTYAEDLRFEVYETDAKERANPYGRGTRWADPARLEALPLRSPTLKALRKLAAGQRRR